MTRSQDSQSLIDLIYEAAVFPNLWTDAMDHLIRSVDAEFAALLVSEPDRWTEPWVGYVNNRSAADSVAAYMGSDIAARTKTTAGLIALDRQGFATTRDVFTDDDWHKDPVFSEWAPQWGLGGECAATFMNSPSGEIMVVHIHRKAGAPDFSRQQVAAMDSLRPHLARAALLSTRWRLEKLRIAAEALAALGLPALVLTRDARVLAANRLIEEKSGYLRWLPRDRMALADPAGDVILRQGLAELGGRAAGPGRSFASRSATGENPVVMHLVPTPGQARDLFDGATSLLVMTPVDAPSAPDLALIRGLFDLSPNEARVARAITEGLSAAEIAARYGVGAETVRSQIKAVLAKTGTRNRMAAAALLGGLSKLPVTE